MTAAREDGWYWVKLRRKPPTTLDDMVVRIMSYDADCGGWEWRGDDESEYDMIAVGSRRQETEFWGPP